MEEVVEDYPRTLAELESRFSSEQACREYLFRLRWPGGFRCSRCNDAKAWPLRSGLWQCARCGYQIIGDGRHDFPGYADTANGLVSCPMVGNQSEERRQRLGATASLRSGKLPDRLGKATQTAAGYGEARAGATLGEGRSGRNVSGWIGRGCSRSTDGQQGIDCRRSPGGRPRDRGSSDAAHPRRLGPKLGSLRGRIRGARPRGPHRRLVGLCSLTEPRIRSQDQFSSGKPVIAFRTVAPCPSGSVTAQALAAGHASGSGERRAPGLLPGRVDLPVQPA
jgi:ribosomal protein L37AE/L43A